MRDDKPPDTYRCPRCSRPSEGRRPRFCPACGAGLDTGGERPAGGVEGRRRPAAWIAAAALVLLLLAAGGALAIVFGGGGGGPAPLPATRAEMKESVNAAREYLTDHWKRRATARVDGAPVYSVSSKLDTDAHTISGRARVLFTNVTGAALDEIVLRVYAGSPVVNPGGSGARVNRVTVDGRAVREKLEGSLLHVPLRGGLAPGAEALLALEFSESIPEISGGTGSIEQLLGRPGGGYGVFGYSGSVYDLGYFIPTVAGYGERGWEDREVPALGDMSNFRCAYYNVSIDAPSDYVVAAPGVRDGGGGSRGRRTHRFRGGPLRDFTAQAGPDYKVVRERVGRTVVSSYYLKGTSRGKDALRFARQALEQYNGHIGGYPYVGLNVCEAPLGGGAGGMEFSGQVQIAGMLYGNPVGMLGVEGSPLEDLFESLGGGLLGDVLEFTVAHEVGHQWWGLAVGSDSIAHPWQDESLTNYCAVLYFRWAHGEEEARKQLQVHVALPYRAGRWLGGGDDLAVDTPADEFSSATRFQAAVYSKGALFFEALEKLVGASAFERGLKKYYESYAFREAAPEDLVASFSGGDAEAVAALHRRWILETHAEEDMAAGAPGADMLDMFDMLLKGLPGGPDLDSLRELLEELVPGGSPPWIPDGPHPDNREPVLPI